MRRRASGVPAMVVLSGIVALTVGIVGAALDWTAFLRSWLAATLTWAALPLGALAVLMTHGLTGGRWGDRSRPVWLALAATLPLFVLAMVPLLFGLDALFSWTRPVQQLPEVVRHKLAYLNEPFFVSRSLFYFAVWLGLAWLQGVWRGPGRGGHAPGLILWLLSLTFFGYDWFLSLEPKFYSDVFGLLLGAGMIGAALAFGLALGSGRTASDTRRDIAHLWLAVLVAWAFLAFSQYIIIWSGNLPDEIGWYLHRGTGAWRVVSWISFLLFFLVPFALLLSSAVKRRQRWLIGTAVICLIGHTLNTHWLVLPAFDDWAPIQYWLTPLAVVALGAVHLGIALTYLNNLEQRHG